MLNSILSLTTEGLTVQGYLICTLASLVYGFIIAFLHMFRNRYTKNFILTLVLLPAIVQTIIMLVNGNLGTGVAVMGAFSLVRFRSLPGNSREIGSIFLAMGVGLATGMGYVGISGLMIVIIGLTLLVMVRFSFGEMRAPFKDLKITIPENLDYTGLFDDLLEKYTVQNELIRVRTVNMGSLYELNYQVLLKKGADEKEFLDEIRCRNGNLNIVCGRIASGKEEL